MTGVSVPTPMPRDRDGEPRKGDRHRVDPKGKHLGEAQGESLGDRRDELRRGDIRDRAFSVLAQ